MKRINIVGLCLAVMCALSVTVAVASASAHEFIVEKTAVGATPFEITGSNVSGTAGEARLNTEIGSIKVVIICKATSITGEIEKEGKSKATIKYSSCELENETTHEKLTTCKVANPTATVKDRLVNGPPVEDEFFTEGTPFTEITITGCTLDVSKAPVEGTQVCKLPEGEKEESAHKIECTAAGSKLKFNKTKTATYSGVVEVKLTTGKKWSAK